MQPSQTALFLALCLGPASWYFLRVLPRYLPHVPLLQTPHSTSSCTSCSPLSHLAPSHLSTLPDSRTAEIKVRARKVSDPTTAPFSRICRPILEGIVSWSRSACMYGTLLHPVGGCTIFRRLYPDMCVQCMQSMSVPTSNISNHDQHHESGPRIQDPQDPQEGTRGCCCYYRS